MVVSRSRSKERKTAKDRGSSSSSSASGSSSRSRSSSASSSSSGSSSRSGSSSSGSSSRSSSSSSSSSRSRSRTPVRRKSRSRSPRRRKRTPSPRQTKVHIGHLTRNVNKDHIMEIFSVYGTIKNVELLSDRTHPEFSRGFAYVEYENADDAEKAIKHMDGGMLDKHEITVVGVGQGPKSDSAKAKKKK